MSHKSLASPTIRQELNKVAQTPFYKEITSGRSQHPPQAADDQYDEDQITTGDDDYDDTSVSSRRVKNRTVRKVNAKNCRKGGHSRAQTSQATPGELSDDESEVQGYDGLAIMDGEVTLAVPIVPRKSTRVRTKTHRFTDPEWLDNDVSTSEDERDEGGL